jgi:hypothetical protein
LHQGFGPQQKLVCPDFFVGDIACQAHDLFLALQQAQAQALLGIFHITLDGFLLALNFLDTQIPKSAGNGGQKKHHRRHRGQVGEPILFVRRLAMPPSAPPRPWPDLFNDRCCSVQFHPVEFRGEPLRICTVGLIQ